jgi:hypothetical protein
MKLIPMIVDSISINLKSKLFCFSSHTCSSFSALVCTLVVVFVITGDWPLLASPVFFTQCL